MHYYGSEDHQGLAWANGHCYCPPLHQPTTSTGAINRNWVRPLDWLKPIHPSSRKWLLKDTGRSVSILFVLNLLFHQLGAERASFRSSCLSQTTLSGRSRTEWLGVWSIGSPAAAFCLYARYTFLRAESVQSYQCREVFLEPTQANISVLKK